MYTCLGLDIDCPGQVKIIESWQYGAFILDDKCCFGNVLEEVKGGSTLPRPLFLSRLAIGGTH